MNRAKLSCSWAERCMHLSINPGIISGRFWKCLSLTWSLLTSLYSPRESLSSLWSTLFSHDTTNTDSEICALYFLLHVSTLNDYNVLKISSSSGHLRLGWVCFFIRFVEMCLCSNGCSAVNGCRQNESLIKHHSTPVHQLTSGEDKRSDGTHSHSDGTHSLIAETLMHGLYFYVKYSFNTGSWSWCESVHVIQKNISL